MDAKVATEIVWTKVLPRNTRATTTAILTESGEELENFDDALNRARNDKKIDLKSIKIGVNLDEIDGSVRQAHRYREIYLNQNTGDDDGANKFMENMLEETSIKTELAVVEEVAHSLFMSSVFKTKSTTLGWLEEHKGYMSHIPGTENDLIQILSEDEIKILQKSYDTKRVEVKAEVLVDLFKRKYYPDFDIEI